jgi:hypothetical protein
MANLRGVGVPITYSEDNSIDVWMRNFRKEREKLKREPANDAERQLLARWLGYRGRSEMEDIVGAATYAYSHFAGEIDSEWRLILADHIRTEAGHGWGYINQAKVLDPSRDHTQPDPEFAEEHGLHRNPGHIDMQKRDFLSFLIAGNLWPYGHCTAPTIQSIVITTPKVLDFEERVVQAEERGHHDAALQKLHDHVWGLIESYGEQPIQKRIAEIDAEAINCGSRVCFDPPRRDFLVKYFGAPVNNAEKFFDWRRYLYLNVLGWEPEPVTVKEWPKGVPMPEQRAA